MKLAATLLFLACACVARAGYYFADGQPILPMKSILVINTGNGVASNTATESGMSAQARAWFASSLETPVPIDCSISDLRVVFSAAPGAGTSYTFHLYKNGSSSGLSVTIADSSTSAISTGSVSFTAGDTMRWVSIPSGTPTAPARMFASAVVTSVSTGESFFPLGTIDASVSNASTTFTSPFFDTWNTTESTASIIMPTSGTISRLRVRMSAGPLSSGSGSGRIFTVMKNGSPTGVTCTIDGTATTASDLSNSITVAAGDTLSLRNEIYGTLSLNRTIVASVMWKPDINGEYIFAKQLANPSETNGQVRYYPIIGYFSSGDTESATSANRSAVMPIGVELKKLYVNMTVAPGSTHSRTIAAYKSDTTLGNLSVTVSGANTSGNNTANSDTLSAGDFVNWRALTTGTPADNTIKWSAVAYIAP